MLRELWSTSIGSGCLAKQDVAPVVDWSRVCTCGEQIQQNVKVQIRARLANILIECVGACEVSPLYNELLGAEGALGPRFTGGRWAHLWVAALSAKPRGQVDGHLTLHDPRAGAAMVFMPELTWTREPIYSIEDGLSLIIPGWIGWSVPILRAQDRCLLSWVVGY